MIRRVSLFAMLLLAVRLSAGAVSDAGFDILAFYRALSRQNLELVDGQLKKLATARLPQKEAYEGVALMTKSRLTPDKAQQVELFRNGRVKLENMISKDPDNPEYRFLRILIQENVPVNFPYRSNLQEDAHFVMDNFARLPREVKFVVRAYSKDSPTLKSFKG